MASLAALPTELLIQIFNQTNNVDLYSLRQACKRFADIAQICAPPTLVLQIDAPNHQAWKLVRSLIKTQTPIKQVREVQIEWYRRATDEQGAAATKQWTWTRHERDQINRLCFKYGIWDQLALAISRGINSEALLPLVLCFTPNIETLDLGEVDVQLVEHSLAKEPDDCQIVIDAFHTLNECMRPEYRYLSEEDDPTRVPVLVDDKYYTRLLREFRKRQFHDIPYSQRGYRLWFQQSLRGSAWRSSLGNIKHFVDRRRYCRLQAPNFAILVRMLWLPQIQTIRFDNCQSYSTPQGPPSPNTLGPAASDYKCPSLRRLELYNDLLPEGDLLAIARTAPGLQHVAITSNRTPAIDVERVGQAFVSFTRGRLTRNDIYIRNLLQQEWGNSRLVSEA
ncbi:hypothetical protein Dda_8944 [Drechslerella dactyloides]|uniref:F-box domain-containing protein n=1 Tax=Drechslerella dactyloides TaxID=74499 RepID=A0AAD6IQ62_DREDA|nr:hypothetical protein Dda_8944 [Drechslerella dactyloides]